jgi:hypothetical protein
MKACTSHASRDFSLLLALRLQYPSQPLVDKMIQMPVHRPLIRLTAWCTLLIAGDPIQEVFQSSQAIIISVLQLLDTWQQFWILASHLAVFGIPCCLHVSPHERTDEFSGVGELGHPALQFARDNGRQET